MKAIEKALVFKIQLLRKNVRQHHPKRPTKGDSEVSKKMKHFKGKKGAGQPLSYPIESDQEILVWLLEIMDIHLPIS